MSRRIVWVDMARGLAMLTILWAHTSVYYADGFASSYTLTVLNALSVFFFVSWSVSVNHKHAVACCIVVLNIQRVESSPEVDGFRCYFLVIIFFVTFLVITFFCFWLLALYKLQANISFCFFIFRISCLSDVFCLSDIFNLSDKFCLYMLFLPFG